MASLHSIAPIFPTSDMDAMRSHYEALGFTVAVHAGGYATAARDDVRIHFRLDPDLAASGERGRPTSGSTMRTPCTRNGWPPAWGRPTTSSTPVLGSGRRHTATRTGTSCVSALPRGALDGVLSWCEIGCHERTHVQPAAYLTANATSRSLATSCAERPGGFLLGRNQETPRTDGRHTKGNPQTWLRDRKGVVTTWSGVT